MNARMMHRFRWVHFLFVVFLAVSPLNSLAQDATPIVDTEAPPATTWVEILVSTDSGEAIPAETTWTITGADQIIDTGLVSADGYASSSSALPSGEYTLTVDAGSGYDQAIVEFTVNGADTTTVKVMLASSAEAPDGEAKSEPATMRTMSSISLASVGMTCPITPPADATDLGNTITSSTANLYDADGNLIDPGSDGSIDLPSPWARFRTEWTFAVQNAKPGDYFSTPLPSNVSSPNQSFPIYAPDGTTITGCATVENNIVTIVLTDYAATYPNFEGDFWVSVDLKHTQTIEDETYQVTFEDGTTISVNMKGDGVPKPADWYGKDGWWNRPDQGQQNPDGAIHWRVTIPMDDSVSEWKVTDDAASGVGMWTHDCDSVTVRAMPDRTDVTPTSVQCTPDGTLTVVVQGVQGRSLEVHWNATITPGNEAGPFSNEATVLGDGTEKRVVQTSLIVRSGGGGAAGAAMVLTKTATLINGEAATPEQLNNLKVGDVVTYTLRVVNTGDKLITGVMVTDPLLNLECDLGDIAAKEFKTCTGTLTITQAHVDAGTEIVNVATATSNDTPPSTDEETVTPGKPTPTPTPVPPVTPTPEPTQPPAPPVTPTPEPTEPPVVPVMPTPEPTQPPAEPETPTPEPTQPPAAPATETPAPPAKPVTGLPTTGAGAGTGLSLAIVAVTIMLIVGSAGLIVNTRKR